ncbi:hypothetical protein Tco_1024592, partial [Tanacetum coccineum]
PKFTIVVLSLYRAQVQSLQQKLEVHCQNIELLKVEEYQGEKHQHIARIIHVEQHTQDMDEPIHQINNSSTTTKNVDISIPDVLLTQQAVMTGAYKKYDGIDVPTN